MTDLTIGGDDYLAIVERQRAEALATIERVKALHHAGCQINSQHWCQDCGHRWPCATIRALATVRGQADAETETP